MESYDPKQAPIAADWLRLDEQERLDCVEVYHRTAKIDIPGPRAHALTHTIVENQLALRDPAAVQRTLDRLLAAGVDRHTAIHAIGAVLFEYMQALSTGKDDGVGVNERYEQSLERIDEHEWGASR